MRANRSAALIRAMHAHEPDKFLHVATWAEQPSVRAELDAIHVRQSLPAVGAALKKYVDQFVENDGEQIFLRKEYDAKKCSWRYAARPDGPSGVPRISIAELKGACLSLQRRTDRQTVMALLSRYGLSIDTVGRLAPERRGAFIREADAIDSVVYSDDAPRRPGRPTVEEAARRRAAELEGRPVVRVAAPGAYTPVTRPDRVEVTAPVVLAPPTPPLPAPPTYTGGPPPRDAVPPYPDLPGAWAWRGRPDYSPDARPVTPIFGGLGRSGIDSRIEYAYRPQSRAEFKHIMSLDPRTGPSDRAPLPGRDPFSI